MSGTLAPRHAMVTRTEGDRGVAQIAGVLSHEAGLLTESWSSYRKQSCSGSKSASVDPDGPPVTEMVLFAGEVDLSFGDRGWPDLRPRTGPRASIEMER